MYRDVSGLFSNKIPEEALNPPEAAPEPETRNDVDNEDDMLYGEDSTFEMPKAFTAPPPKPKYSNWWKKYLNEIKPTYWLFLVRENSNLEIYSLPEYRLSYIVRNLAMGHKVLIDSLESVPMLASGANLSYGENAQKEYEIKEILMVALGNHGSRPLLLVRLENDLYIYQVYRFTRGNLKMRFKKLSHNIIYRPSHAGYIETENSDFYILQERISRMRYFSNIAGISKILYFLIIYNKKFSM